MGRARPVCTAAARARLGLLPKEGTEMIRYGTFLINGLVCSHVGRLEEREGNAWELVSPGTDMKLGGPPAKVIQLPSWWWLHVASSSGQLMKPRSLRLLPEPKGCLTEVSPEAFHQSCPWWGSPSWAQVSSRGPSIRETLASAWSGRGCPKQDESAFSWEVTPAQGHFSQT